MSNLMRGFLNIFFFLMSFLSFGSIYAYNVVIDPGHGGVDDGAIYNKIREAKVVLDIAKKLDLKLKNNSNINTKLTRLEDVRVDLDSRVKIAEEFKADLLISLHLNAVKEPSAKGVEFYFQNSLPPDEESMHLAFKEGQVLNQVSQIKESQLESRQSEILTIVEDLKKQMKMLSSAELSRSLYEIWQIPPGNPKHLVVKQAPFRVVTNTSMPSVLIEMGFLSNKEEAQNLTNSEYQDLIVEKIYAAVLRFKEKMDKRPMSTLQ